MLRVALAIALATFLVVPAPTAAQEGDATTPLLEALAYVHPKADPVSLDFVDWAQLKRLYGSEDVTSASPLGERQRFLLEVARNESVPVPLGLDRLATWSEAWGWDTTDLGWQARYWDGRSVLRFSEGWDAQPFRDALERWGYQPGARGDIEIWHPSEREVPSELHLERVGGEITADRSAYEPSAVVTISADGRTVVLHTQAWGATSKQLRRASRADPGRLAGTPAVRAAAALGNVVVANTAASHELICRWPDEAGMLPADREVSAMVDGLHAYEARADGYTRSVADAPATLRYVFSYRRPRQARADLEGRSTLVELNEPWSPPAGNVALLDARVEGRQLVLDVEPEGGHPGPYTSWRVRWAPFVLCGSPA